MSRTFAMPLSRQDAGYLRRETPGQPMHFVLLCTLAPDPDERVTVEHVRDQVAAHIHRIPALRYRLLEPPFGIGPLRWIDDPDFRIDQHVRSWPTIQGDGGGRLDALTELTAQPMDRTRPLWDVRVASSSGGNPPLVAIVAHHALMDGGLMRNVVDALFGPGAADGDMAWQPRRAPTAARLLVEGVALAARRRLARRDDPPLAQGASTSAGGWLAGPVTEERTIQRFTLPLEDLRLASKAAGVTINDVFLAMVTQGLRDLLEARGSADVSREVLALVPRDVRGAQESDAPGNRTWSILVPLPVGLQDPAARLDAIARVTRAGKGASRSAGAAEFAFDVSVSNVSLGGPHAVCGTPIRAHHAAVPLQGQNRLAIVGLSTPDTFGITVTADSRAFPDIGVLVAGLARGLVDIPASDGIVR